MLSDGALTGLALKARQLLRSLDEPPRATGLRVPDLESASALPVLRCLPDFAADESGFGASLVADLCRNHHVLMWRQTYAAGDVGDGFLRNYGYAEIVGMKSIPSRRLACGFLILGPSTLYPRHRHEAEEIYIPLRGTARAA